MIKVAIFGATCVLGFAASKAAAVQMASKADSQKPKISDRKLEKNIRQSIQSDKSVSTFAHRVKVVSQDGTVTLTGPVLSELDKKSVGEDAEAVIGPSGRMSNQTDVLRQP